MCHASSRFAIFSAHANPVRYPFYEHVAQLAGRVKEEFVRCNLWLLAAPAIPQELAIPEQSPEFLNREAGYRLLHGQRF